jgi:anaerobic magnesium-protoporphyrin IX monomethyl ester cyclase
MKILFVIQQLDFADHISISYLSSIAKENKHTTYFCSLRGHNLKETVDTIKPDLVAYSANIMGFKELVNANKTIQDIHKCTSILGGPQATFSPETFEESGMDVYCIGEGEYAFRDFLDRLEHNKDYNDVLNLITSKRKNEIRDLISNLDELPFPDRDLVLSNSWLKNTPKKTFYTTRGCPFSCSYCCNDYYHKLYKGKGTIFRRFSVERIIKEMEYVQQHYKMDFVKIGDDLFSLKADDWLKEFTEKYSKRIDKPFNCYLRFDRVDDDILLLLKKAGCYSVNLSVDSLSQHVREKVLNRSMKKVNIEKELRRIKDFNINTFVNFMLATPESKLEDDLKTIDVSRKAKVTYINFTTTEPMKGTRLYDYCVTNRYIDPDTFVGDMTHMFEESPLSCFSKREKQIRYNIYTLGCLVSKLPIPFYNMGIWIIKHVPPNKLFVFIRQFMYQYHIENKIFLFSKKSKKIKDERIKI